MSFLDDILSVGKDVGTWLGGNTIGSSIARTAITGYALNKLYNSINKENDSAQADKGARQQVQADPNNSIPVVYGTAWLGGIITDATLTSDNATMYYCLTLCEKTGNTNLGSGAASTFTFGEIYRDNMRLIFGSDGITVTGAIDSEGNNCGEISGKIQVYCFAGGSGSPVVPANYTNGSLANADAVFPNWTSNHDMTNLIFAIVKVDYDAVNDVRGLGEFRFQITNSMTLPGDCLYDYMTNTVYGAGIPAGSINL